MARQLVQKLYLQQLPPGLNMTVTDFQIRIPPNKEWEVEFDPDDVGKLSIDSPPLIAVRSPSVANLEGQYPLTVSPSRNEGLIGAVKFEPFGTGGKAYIATHIEGTFKDLMRNSYNIDERGYITVSASDWKPTGRPDFTKISYNRGDANPTILSIRVPEVGEPMDAMFSFHVEANGNHMFINGRGNS